MIVYIEKVNRPNLCKMMDKYLRKNIQNEDLFYGIWTSMGMPDGANDDDYMDLKDNDEFWTDCLEAFMKCVLLDG